MSKVNIKCPSCKKNLGAVEQTEYLYGSPIKVCPKCKAPYFDARFHEIAVEGIRKEDVCDDEEFLAKKRKSGRNTILGGLGVMVLFFVILAAGWIFYFFPVLSVLLIIGGFKTINETKPAAIEKKRAELEREKVLSEQRLRDPQYVQQLHSFGYAMNVTVE